jgi:hypothetical protein
MNWLPAFILWVKRNDFFCKTFNDKVLSVRLSPNRQRSSKADSVL